MSLSGETNSWIRERLISRFSGHRGAVHDSYQRRNMLMWLAAALSDFGEDDLASCYQLRSTGDLTDFAFYCKARTIGWEMHEQLRRETVRGRMRQSHQRKARK